MKKVFRELPAFDDSSILVKQELGTQFAAPYHFHHGYEFTYIVKGHGKFYGGDRLMNFQDGDFYFFGPGFAHYFINDKAFVKSGESAHSIIIQFGKDFFGWGFFSKPEFKKVKALLALAGSGIKIKGQDEQIKPLLVELTQQTGLKAIILFLQLVDMLSNLPKKDIGLISLSSYKGSLNDTDSNKLENVYQYVLENFKEDVNTRKAAALVCMNEPAFCRYFKRRTKKTFSQFVNTVRITHATYLLEDNDISMANVCYDCGFNNLSYFNRQFKAITGKTPFNFRKELA